jgi:hypothetical protein
MQTSAYFSCFNIIYVIILMLTYEYPIKLVSRFCYGTHISVKLAATICIESFLQSISTDCVYFGFSIKY